MLYGVSIFATDYSVRPDELARMLEERGFESVWFPEHTHIPASRKTPYPAGGDLPEQYWHTYDLFVSLAAAATATTRLKVASGICLVVERDPITTAKEVASIDYLSGGRMIFGIGGGWNAEEMENHGTRYRQRWRVLRERVLAMKEIWTQEAAEFHGEHVDFDKLWSYPKPVKKPHPPILMGGDGPTTFDRVVEFCDGWMPIMARRPGGWPQLESKIHDLRERARRMGRDPESISVSVFGAAPERESIDQLEQAGVERVIFGLPSADRSVAERLADRYAALIR